MNKVFFVLLMLTIIDDVFFFSYEYVVPHIPAVTPDGWQTTKVLAIVLVYLIGEKYSRERIKGTVTEKEIKRDDESQAVSFGAVASIKGEIFYANLFYPDARLKVSDGTTEMELCIAGKRLVPLTRTRLNQWLIKEDSFSITPSEADEILIEYAPIGKYAWPLSYWAFDWYIALTVLVGRTEGMWEFFRPLFIPLCVLVLVKFLFNVGLGLYRKTTIRLTANDIQVFNTQGLANAMALCDVERVEKGVFRVKVTGKRGQVVYLPRGCYLLSELIEELVRVKRA